MTQQHPLDDRPWKLVKFDEIPGKPCPCGTARRGFEEVQDFPGTIHRTSISADAKTHYHKQLTEVYYILECEDGASMQLDEETIPLQANMSVLIPPGVRHRACGKMEVLIVCLPKFDETDEWFD